MAIVLSILNFKGGVCKTTTAVNLSKAFCMQGKRVLCIDTDPQGNASKMMGYRATKDKVNTLYEAINGVKPFKECIYMENDNEDSFDYIPSKDNLYQCEQELVSRTGRERLLAVLLKDVQDDYDFVIIDCPPNYGILSVNAMCASDHLIVPINCEVFALDGMGIISAKYEEVKQLINPKLNILGYLMSRYDTRLKIHKDSVVQMEKHFSGKVFSTKIRGNVQITESPAARTNIFDYAPGSPGAKDYEAFAKEVLNKIELN